MIPVDLAAIVCGTAVIGFGTDILATKNSMCRSSVLLIFGHWLIAAGLAGWGWLNYQGVGLVLFTVLATQLPRIPRRFLFWIVDRRSHSAAAAPYLERYG